MADFTELKNIVRKGIVQSVNQEAMKARVKFGDKGGIISGELHILVRHRIIVPTEKETQGKKDIAMKHISQSGFQISGKWCYVS